MAKKSDSNRPIIDLLNQILQVEYSIIVYYPRLVNLVTDIELKNMQIFWGEHLSDMRMQ
jgi:hypothetical protein